MLPCGVPKEWIQLHYKSLKRRKAAKAQAEDGQDNGPGDRGTDVLQVPVEACSTSDPALLYAPEHGCANLQDGVQHDPAGVAGPDLQTQGSWFYCVFHAVRHRAGRCGFPTPVTSSGVGGGQERASEDPDCQRRGRDAH